MMYLKTETQEARVLARKEIRPLIFILDDDISICESLEAFLKSKGYEVEIYTSAREFFSRPGFDEASCLILDLFLQETSGLEIQRQIIADRPQMSIVFITGNGDVRTTARAMKAGAIDFLTKPIDGEALLNAIQSGIGRSRKLVSRELETHDLRERYAGVTTRERDVLLLIANGLSNKEIGSFLGISEVTVKAHRGNLMRKMKADSLPRLMQQAFRLRSIRALANPTFKRKKPLES